MTPDTARLVGLIRDLYKIHPVGGPLHVYLDDGNLGDHIEPAYEHYGAEELDELWFRGVRIAELSVRAPAVVEGLGVSMRQLCDEIAGLMNGMTESEQCAAVAAAARRPAGSYPERTTDE